MADKQELVAELQGRFGEETVAPQETRDDIATVWVPRDVLRDVLGYLRAEAEKPFSMLYDLTAIDERGRQHREGLPEADFTVVYRLLSFERNDDVRVKVALHGEHPSMPTVTDMWPCANWYEREVWDMFGIGMDGHPDLRRILLPPWWKGHALRKEHPARATEMGPFVMPQEQAAEYEAELGFKPEDVGWERGDGEHDYMFINFGPQHPGTHGVMRLVLQMDGQEIRDSILEIGFHHRGSEKMAERQSWHSYIPYTDRVDYLGGVMNNLPYVMAVERLCGIEVPERAKYIRVLMAELFRIISHLVFIGTFAQDIGMMSPVFYTFTDREEAFHLSEAVTGGRMHPSWFRIGGVAMDLPDGWEPMFRKFIAMMHKSLDEYHQAIMRNKIIQIRTRDVAPLDTETAIAWGATGPVLRSTGMEWDFRKKRPYSGYEEFDFDIPVGEQGDCYDRAMVHMEEMRQSLRIMEQCVDKMPGGPYKSLQALGTPPIKDRALHDIETLIHHFLSVTWGPVVPPGEAEGRIEGTKGAYSYYCVSDGSTASWRTRIRAASFPHVQMVPMMARGLMIPDLVAILGSQDFVLADVDR